MIGEDVMVFVLIWGGLLIALMYQLVRRWKLQKDIRRRCYELGRSVGKLGARDAVHQNGRPSYHRIVRHVRHYAFSWLNDHPLPSGRFNARAFWNGVDVAEHEAIQAAAVVEVFGTIHPQVLWMYGAEGSKPATEVKESAPEVKVENTVYAQPRTRVPRTLGKRRDL